MRSQWLERLRVAIDTMRDYAVSQGRIISASDLKNVKDKITLQKELEPSTNDFTLYALRELDIEEFTSYLYSIQNDVNFIDRAVSYLESITENIEVLADLEKRSLRTTENIGRKYVSLLKASTFIEGVTREVRIPEEIEIQGLTLLADKGVLTMPVVKSTVSRAGDYKDSDVSVRLIDGQYVRGFTVSGSKRSVIAKSFRNGIRIAITSSRIERVGVEVRLDMRVKGVNKLTILSTPGAVATRFEVYRREAENSDLEKLHEETSNQEQIDISVSGDILQLIVRMYKDFPDVELPDRKEYILYLNKVTAKVEESGRSGEARSEAIELPEGTTHVAVVSDEVRPENTSIKYEIAAFPKKDEPVDSAVWFEVVPNNIDPSTGLVDGELPEDRFIDLSRGKITKVLQPEKRWKLTALESFRVPLFNILEGSDGDLNDAVKIENGRIVPSDVAVQVLYDKIQLFNGVGDWEVVEEPVVTEDRVENLIHIAYVDQTTQWFAPVDLLESRSTIIRPDSDTNSIIVSGEVVDSNNFYVADSAGRTLGAVINSISFDGVNSTLTLNLTLMEGESYEVSYAAKVRDTVEVDETTVTVVANDTTLEEGKDYIYSTADRRVVLLRGGRELKSPQALLLSYNRRVTDSISSRYYRTHVIVDKETTITISPFTQLEYAAGNFHRIDGEDVSLVTTYTLSPGIHIVESTQPEPSVISVANSSDKNYYTGEYSNAGVDLEGIDIRAFKNEMRVVSQAEMEYNIPPGDRKRYTIVDGMILMNKVPSYIEEEALLDPDKVGEDGEYLRNKRYDKATQKYVPLPEGYEVIVPYTDTVTKKYVRLRVTMSRVGEKVPKIRKLGVVPISL